MIRAKMNCDSVETGHRGEITHRFNAVYEGSSELQSVTENAIFGKLTPAGHLTITTKSPINGVDAGEEYFVDLVGGAGRTEPAAYHFQADLDLEFSKNHGWATEFRYVARTGPYVTLSLTIANPPVVEILKSFSVVCMAVRVDRGRKSDAEIEIRRRLLEEARARAVGVTDPRAAQGMAFQIAGLERKLARAEGADYDGM